MLFILKWYFILAGITFTSLLIVGAVWFASLPAAVKDFLYTAILPVDAVVAPVPFGSGGDIDSVTQLKQVVSSTTDVVVGTVSDEQQKALESIGLGVETIPIALLMYKSLVLKSYLVLLELPRLKTVQCRRSVNSKPLQVVFSE
jgi:hypothetical protein